MSDLDQVEMFPSLRILELKEENARLKARLDKIKEMIGIYLEGDSGLSSFEALRNVAEFLEVWKR